MQYLEEPLQKCLNFMNLTLDNWNASLNELRIVIYDFGMENLNRTIEISLNFSQNTRTHNENDSSLYIIITLLIIVIIILLGFIVSCMILDLRQGSIWKSKNSFVIASGIEKNTMSSNKDKYQQFVDNNVFTIT